MMSLTGVGMAVGGTGVATGTEVGVGTGVGVVRSVDVEVSDG